MGEGRANDRHGGVCLARLDLGDQSAGASERPGARGRQDQVDRIPAVARPCDLVERRLAYDPLGQRAQYLARRRSAVVNCRYVP
jgi:hypothetical protein